jgi:hypothetical protein
LAEHPPQAVVDGDHRRGFGVVITTNAEGCTERTELLTQFAV